MNIIITSVVIVASIGLVVGVVLAVASIIMAVPKDEKAEAILEVLPGANCGACGYSGCAGYAKALAENTAENGLCSPGGQDTIQAVATLLGQSAVQSVRTTAIVNCMGSIDNTEKSMIYQGINTCKAGVQLYGGIKDCSYGCLGFGDCINACEYNAIKIVNGIAVVNERLCASCKKCVAVCPKNLISIVEVKPQAVVLCSNCDKAINVKKDCKVGCIGCMKCKKVCPENAITIKNFNATIDPNLCSGCFQCVEQCPQKCIVKKFV